MKLSNEFNLPLCYKERIYPIWPIFSHEHFWSNYLSRKSNGNCHDIIEVMQNASNLSVCFCRRNGQQMFSYTTDVKKLKLMVNVSNVESQNRKAEDAYRALLNVTIPSSLSYASLNPKVRSLDVLRNYTSVLSCNSQRSPVSRPRSISRPRIDFI